MPLNPLKIDPQRATTLRRRFIGDMRKRFRKLRGDINRLVITEDAFGLASGAKGATGGLDAPQAHVTSLDMVFNERFAFATDDAKLDAYRKWLKERVDAGILEVGAGHTATPWTDQYVTSAYKKGLLRAYTDTNASGLATAKDFGFVQGGKAEFLRSSFAGPVGQSKLKTLSTRSFAQLEGVTAQMDQEMSRILADGLAAGHGPRRIAGDLNKSVSGLEKKRALAIARTETAHAHSEGQLDAFEAMGVEELGIMAEWSTAGDGKVCPLCVPLEGIILTVKEARGMLPRHPNCLAGDMRVLAPGALAILKTHYTGEIIELATVNGRRITVTSNHVLLTKYGFTTAESVYKGIDLAIDDGLYGPFEAPDYNRDVPSIADEFRAASKALGCRSVSVPTSAKDLHGEGRSCDDKIDIIFSDSLLLDNGQPDTLHEQGFPFCGGDGVGRLALGTLAKILIRAAHASDGSMGGVRDALAFLLGRVFEAKQISLGAIPGTQASVRQAFPDHATVDIVTLRDCLHRHPVLKKLDDLFGGDIGSVLTGSAPDLTARLAEAFPDGVPLDPVMFGNFVERPSINGMQFDQILSVHRRHVTSFPVYDVQTTSTMYTVEGLITSNCRCAWIPAGVGEHVGGTTTTQFAGEEQGLEAPGTAPTGKKAGQVWHKDEVGSRLRDSIKAEKPKLSIKEARKVSLWKGADLTKVTAKLKPGSKQYAAAVAKKKADAGLREAAKTQVAEVAAAKIDHSLKVKVGMAKKSYGLAEEDLEYFESELPTLSKTGAEKYITAKGLDPNDWTGEDWAAWGEAMQQYKAPSVPALKVQMMAMDDAIAAKRAGAKAIKQKATAKAAEKKLAGEVASKDAMDTAGKKAAKWKPDTAPSAQVLDHADYDLVPGWDGPHPGKTQSYGVILFDDEGRVLMREPTNHYGGVNWTFAKGGGTKPGSTAFAELAEETGHKAAIHDVLPGKYKSTDTSTNYFIGKSAGYDGSLMDAETHATKWMTMDEALKGIALGDNAKAVARDTLVLKDAFAYMKTSDGKTFKALVGTGAKGLDDAKVAATKAAHGHNVKLGMSQKHYAKEKFGGGVVDADWVNPATKQKLGPTGLNKVLSEKGWHTTTVKAEVLDQLEQADDVVAQKAIMDGMKKAPKAQTPTPAVPKPSADTPTYKIIDVDMAAIEDEMGAAAVLDLDGLGIDEKVAWLKDEADELGLDVDDYLITTKAPAPKAKLDPKELEEALSPQDLRVVQGMDNADDQLEYIRDIFGYDVSDDFTRVPTAGTVTKPAPKAPKPLPTTPIVTDAINLPLEKDLKKVKDLPGQTKPWQGVDPTGKNWVVKDVSGSGIDPAHLRSEALADDLYRKLGFAVPDGGITEAPGGPMKITEFLEGGETLAQWKKGKSVAEIKEMHDQIKKGFVADALFANHDVAGLSNDNIFIVGGKAYRIDNGGALTYRAQGQTKRTWGAKVQELDTMRDPKVNKNTAAIYKGLTDEEINAQIGHIVTHKEDILSAIDDADVRNVMAQRIDDLQARLPAAPSTARRTAPVGQRRAAYVNTPETVDRVKTGKSNGLNIAGDRGDIEDNNILVWEQVDADGKKQTRMQLKVTKDGSAKVVESLGDEMTAAEQTAAAGRAGNVHPEDGYWGAILNGAKTVSVHAKDGSYNASSLFALEEAKQKIKQKLKTATGSTKKMLKHYEVGIKDIEAAKAAGKPLKQGALVRYAHTPKAVPDAPKPRRRDLRVRKDTGINVPTAKFKDGVATLDDGANTFSSEAYIIDAGDGIEIRFLPNDGSFSEKSGRALHGTVSVTVPEGVSETSINKAMQMLEHLGIDGKAPSQAYEEALYLHRGVYINKKHRNSAYMKIWENPKLSDEERVVQMKAWIKKDMKIDVDEVPHYDPHGVTKHADGSGFRHWNRWDIDEAEFAKEMKDYTLVHTMGGGLSDTREGVVASTLGSILDSGGEFTSTSGRIRKGVSVASTGGASSPTDIGTGGASYFFTRIRKTSGTGKTHGVFFKPKNLLRQDTVSYSGDKFGRISSISERAIDVPGWKANAAKRSNEAIFKEGFGLDDIDYIKVRPNEVKAVIKTFHDRGITTLPDGRKIEDIVTSRTTPNKR